MKVPIPGSVLTPPVELRNNCMLKTKTRVNLPCVVELGWVPDILKSVNW